VTKITLRHCVSLVGFCLLLTSGVTAAEQPSEDTAAFVRVSPRDARYFELTNGRAYVPVGFNLVGPPEADEMERVVDTMAEHGVNYCRIWLDQSLWSVEHARSGEYDPQRAEQLDRFLNLCRPRGIRVKMCIEWFRSIVAQVPDPPQRGSFPKPLHHVANGGFYQDMEDFLNSRRGREQFQGKLRWYADRYGDDPAVFAWELWNEMNAVRGPWQPWTEVMLPELQRLFPKNLAVQSLGSFDRDRAREQYRQLCLLADNDVLQVHRYLDLGAELQICHGPVDVLAADAVDELRAFGIRKPIILTETGAVKPKHTGASELYEKDRDGILLHDMLFAPFFAGAAGTGHVWFWRQAIDTPDHWHHFQRFHRALEGIDPPGEAWEPIRMDHPELRIYALRGKQTLLAWCRDRQNDWRTELEMGIPPRQLSEIALPRADFELPEAFQDAPVDVYDPWTDRWTAGVSRGAKITLPPFRRSVVFRIRADPAQPAPRPNTGS
jgi:hypothetical protein